MAKLFASSGDADQTSPFLDPPDKNWLRNISCDHFPPHRIVLVGLLVVYFGFLVTFNTLS